MIPYDGEKAARMASYNFCFICKDRLEVIHDEFDEGWYFVNAKQIRAHVEEGNGDEEVLNVHAVCLKEIELSDKHLSSEPNLGEKRPRVYEKVSEDTRQKIETMIESLETEKKRKRCEIEV